MILKVKKSEKPFAQIERTTLQDERLSFRAKGILAYLLSKPEDWQTNIKDVQNHGTEGRDAIRSAMKELQEFGYAKLTPLQDENGRLIGKSYTISETPELDEDDTERRKTRPSENPKVGNSESRETRPFTNKEYYKDENISNKEGNDNVRTEQKKLFSEPSFDEFWNLYNKKVAKNKCQQKWNRLKVSEKQAIMEHLPDFVKATPEIEFRCNPLTYLNQRRWEDEYLPSPNKGAKKAGLSEFINEIT